MKKIFAVAFVLLLSTALFAKQHVKYYRYLISVNVAHGAQSDLEKLIEQNKRIISFSLDYKQKTMIVVYEDNK